MRLCLSVELDKTGQYADWQKRPLSDQQIRYALGDVVYLARLYPLLRKRLEERGRLAWLEEIQAGSLDIEGYEQSGEESFLRLSTKMRGQEARKVLRRLCLWREGYAKRRDRPRQWICSDATIVALAKLRPACGDEVRNCRALGGWGKNQRMVEEVLEQVRASGNDDDVVLEELPAAREEERSLLSVLRALQRSCGEGEDVAIELLGAQSELVSFVRGGKAVLYEGDALRVFHAGKQDWEILWRHFGSLPRHVFDTQVAAALLGYGGQCGYERLVRLCLSVELDKTGQYADWQKRPLSDQQIRYALGDVVYLARLYPLLRKRLEERGRLAWLEEIQAGSLDIEGYEQSGEESFLRLSTKMRGQEARKVLRRLCLWREGYAKRRDRPRQWICSDADCGFGEVRPACGDEVRN